jgi:hypothetical protein
MRCCVGGIAAVLLGLFLFMGPAEAAPKIFTQGPCASGNLKCKTFFAHSPIPVIRSFSFTAPRAGVAQVTFQGTLTCTNSTGVESIVDLAAQIVGSKTAVASANGAGGAHHGVVLPRVGPDATQTPTVEINLASTRTITYPTGGKKNLYFRITKLRMDPTTACDVYSAAFTVLYLS